MKLSALAAAFAVAALLFLSFGCVKKIAPTGEGGTPAENSTLSPPSDIPPPPSDAGTLPPSPPAGGDAPPPAPA
ncbi:MAG: hypothetical protein WC861_02420 [Candidatus Micrarchaeia archaeon]